MNDDTCKIDNKKPVPSKEGKIWPAWHCNLNCQVCIAFGNSRNIVTVSQCEYGGGGATRLNVTYLPDLATLVVLIGGPRKQKQIIWPALARIPKVSFWSRVLRPKDLLSGQSERYPRDYSVTSE